MEISARTMTTRGHHEASVATGGIHRPIWIQPRASGFGSSVNGGELLFLALATCYGNDIVREAERRGIALVSVEVEVDGEFSAEGEAASRVTYRAKVVADAPEEMIRELMLHTDQVAEIHNTLRSVTPVTLSSIETVSSPSMDSAA